MVDISSLSLRGDSGAAVTAATGPLDCQHQQMLQSNIEQGFPRVENPKDIQAAEKDYQKSMQLAPYHHSDEAGHLQSESRKEYQTSGNLDEMAPVMSSQGDLERPSSLQKFPQDPTLEGNPDIAGDLQTLAASLREQFLHQGDLEALEGALEKGRDAVHLTPQGHAERPSRLQDLARSFRKRYQRLGDLEDLGAALQADEEAISLIPHGHPDTPRYLRSLAMSLRLQYTRFGELKDLEAALVNNQLAVDMTRPGTPDREKYLSSLATLLIDRYRRLGDLQDLEAGVKLHREAVDLIPDGHTDKAPFLHSLAASLKDRYDRLGNMEDLDATFQATQEALNLTPEGHPCMARYLKAVAVCFIDRYQRFGHLHDLEAALRMDQEVVKITPGDHPDRANYLRDLAMSFRDRYRRLGDLKDLEAGIQICREAVNLTPAGHPDRPLFLQTLAVALTDRYERLGDLKDLEVALRTKEEATRLTPDEHPDKPTYLQGLAVGFGQLYRRLGHLHDLEAALHNNKQAVDLTPEDDLYKAARLERLAQWFRYRYLNLGTLDDLEAALQIKQKACDLTPEDHPNRGEHLQSLAVSIRDRYKHLGDPNDLETILQMKQQALQLTPEGHPERPAYLQSLALSFTDRYRQFRDAEDLNAVHTYYEACFENTTFTPEFFWNAALNWASFTEEFDLSKSGIAYSAAFRRLPDLLWIGHAVPVRYDAIRRLDIERAASNATRTMINISNYTAAVEIIEQGLATIFQQSLELRPDVEGLHPDLADDFQRVSFELYSGTSKDLKSAANKRNDLLKTIRGQPGFEHFLLPKPYEVLRKSSQGGPVVILNSHQDHCDAVIILNPAAEPLLVALPNVTLDLLQSQRSMLKNLIEDCNVRTREQSTSTRLFGHPERFKTPEESFGALLTWLWTHVVSPIYRILQSQGMYRGRLWWLPTGAFTRLPLHASPPDNDEFTHSYTPTLGMLLDAYMKKPSSDSYKLGVVGVTHTGSGGTNYLEGVHREVEQILAITKTPGVQCLEGQQATVEAVMQQLKDCSLVHLACHGKQHVAEPAKSHLQLYDGILELDTILRMPLPNAEFAFLAACQTAMGDSKLTNESFHLGGGFIAAGFRSVIGTMWSMNDRDGPLVSEIVYSHLFRDGGHPQTSDAAEALQLAVKQLRARKVSYERWIPFIHIGV